VGRLRAESARGKLLAPQFAGRTLRRASERAKVQAKRASEPQGRHTRAETAVFRARFEASEPEGDFGANWLGSNLGQK